MTPEILQAAANRLQKAKDGKYDIDVLIQIYGDKEIDDLFECLDLDRLKLADDWMEQHPADDAEPVTEEWLRSVGFSDELPPPIREEVYDGTMFLIAKIPDKEYEGSDDGQYVLIFDDMSGGIWTVSNGNCYGGSTIVRSTTTRQQVRQLLQALGVKTIQQRKG